MRVQDEILNLVSNAAFVSMFCRWFILEMRSEICGGRDS